VVAPSGVLHPDVPELISKLAGDLYPAGPPEIVFHPQCFFSHNHFAGSDEVRADAFVQMANDEDLDAIWFARGGYGACRIAEAVLARLSGPARLKTYLGYSDGGVLLGALHGAGIGAVAHGSMCQDILREGGAAAVGRSLGWLVDRDPAALEPSIDGAAPTAAFNIAVLSQIIGTPLQPDLEGHVLMLEEVAEYMYRIDRYLFHITSNPGIRRVAGIRLGRCSQIPENDPDFGLTEEEVARFWCARAGIPYLGRADIGHDSANHVVPFGRLPQT
jgi:muramoyltetrapeptide carboxypeptidase